MSETILIVRSTGDDGELSAEYPNGPLSIKTMADVLGKMLNDADPETFSPMEFQRELMRTLVSGSREGVSP